MLSIKYTVKTEIANLNNHKILFTNKNIRKHMYVNVNNTKKMVSKLKKYFF